MKFGDKNDVAIVAESLGTGSELSLYVNGENILLFQQGAAIYSYRTDDITNIGKWLKERLPYITSDDPFPIETHEMSAAEMAAWGLQHVESDLLYEKTQDWAFRHSWLAERPGGFLADIYFRRVGRAIEISWDNEHLYSESGIRFVHSKGKALVSLSGFLTATKGFIRYCPPDPKV